jgi:hypothetical protein
MRDLLNLLHDGIIMQKIVLIWQFESMIRDGGVCWQKDVGINGETAVPSDEPSHLWLKQEAHQESDPLRSWLGRHCSDQLMLYYQLCVSEGGIHDPENIQKTIDVGKYSYFITVITHLTSSSLECSYAYYGGYCFLPVLETSMKKEFQVMDDVIKFSSSKQHPGGSICHIICSFGS